jgi:hypothetical protein
MTVRPATNDDLYQIANLAQEFGHLMTYMQSEEGIKPHIKDIVVYEEEEAKGITGFYHYRPILNMNDILYVLEEKTIPDFLLDAAFVRSMRHSPPLAILMQGGSHREVFAELIKYLQTQYRELWCWCSIKSRRPEGYRELGFSFNPSINYTFQNVHVGRESTYQLGRWIRGQ